MAWAEEGDSLTAVHFATNWNVILRATLACAPQVLTALAIHAVAIEVRVRRLRRDPRCLHARLVVGNVASSIKKLFTFAGREEDDQRKDASEIAHSHDCQALFDAFFRVAIDITDEITGYW